MADIIVNCPNCRQDYSIDPANVGRQFQCEKCGNTFTAARPVGMTPPPPPVYFGEPAPVQGPLSKAALASIICGVFCLVWPVSVAALVTGIIGVVNTRNYQARGAGLAIAGIVLGSIGLVADPPAYFVTWAVVHVAALQKSETLSQQSEANLRQIGAAIIQYRNQYNNAYPPDLATLATAENLSTDLFVYPGGTDTPASSAASIESGGHLSYIYLGASPGIGDSDVVMYERGTGHMSSIPGTTSPRPQRMRGLNVLFADGRATFESKATADRDIRLTRQKLGSTGQ
jgi:type II secretory pathway pseudopilin PulG